MTSPVQAPQRAASVGLVYRPQADTALLIEALDDVELTGRRVLDLCTGSGAVAVAAARRGATEVVAVDACPLATATARDRRPSSVAWRAVCSTAADYADPRGFDVVTCNPPYVPTPPTDIRVPVPGPAHAWDAGPDGREVLDVLCARAPELLLPGGLLLVVQSALAGPDRTAELLCGNGFDVEEVRRRRIPFGPVTRSRLGWLVAQGLLRPGEDAETIVVLAARRDGDSR